MKYNCKKKIERRSEECLFVPRCCRFVVAVVVAVVVVVVVVAVVCCYCFGAKFEFWRQTAHFEHNQDGEEEDTKE